MKLQKLKISFNFKKLNRQNHLYMLVEVHCFFFFITCKEIIGITQHLIMNKKKPLHAIRYAFQFEDILQYCQSWIKVENICNMRAISSFCELGEGVIVKLKTTQKYYRGIITITHNNKKHNRLISHKFILIKCNQL